MDESLKPTNVKGKEPDYSMMTNINLKYIVNEEEDGNKKDDIDHREASSKEKKKRYEPDKRSYIKCVYVVMEYPSREENENDELLGWILVMEFKRTSVHEHLLMMRLVMQMVIH